MAQGKSGSFVIQNTSQAGLTMGSTRFTWSETYDIATNTSVVSITNMELLAANDSLNYNRNYGYGNLWFNGSASINGSTVATISRGSAFLVVPQYNTYKAVSASNPAFPWSATVVHDNDGSKTVTISISIHGLSSGSVATTNTNINGSTNIQLTNIPRSSSVNVSNGTLGVQQTITVSRQSTLYSHSISWQCGSASGWVCGNTTQESFQFTGDLSLAAQNTSGTSVPVTFTIQTYNGDAAIGSPVSKTVSMAIPDSVRPSCALSVSDPTGYSNVFGGYVQSKSKFRIVVNPALAYNSPISAYSVSADGSTYGSQDTTTAAIRSSGSVTINASVTDQRGRSGSASQAVTVIPYSNPRISMLSVNRCNADGTENPNGSYASARYSFSITNLSNRNTKEIKLLYKKSSASNWTEKVLTSVYSATNAIAVFPADDGSTYDVQLSVRDYWSTITQRTSVSTAAVTFHIHRSGRGFAFGKVSEEEDCLDVGWSKLKVNGSYALTGSRKVNGKALSSDITLTAADVGARPSNWTPTAADVGARPNNWTPNYWDVGASKINLIWTNASPRSAFAHQALNFGDLGGYAGLFVVFARNTNELDTYVERFTNGCFTAFVPRDVKCFGAYREGDALLRNVLLTGNSIWFGPGRLNESNNDSVAIPIRIYGIANGQ